MDATVSKAEYDRVVAEKNEQIATLKFRYEKLVRQIFDASSEQRPTTGSLSDGRANRSVRRGRRCRIRGQAAR